MNDAPTLAAVERITAVVVTYNSATVLRGLLEALPGALGDRTLVELAVADNASTDRTLDIVADAAPTARVVPMGRNAGYAAGINAALAAAPPSDAVLVLNPDTRPRAGSIATLARALERPGVGIAVPRLVGPDGTTWPSLRREPTVLRALGEAVLGGGLAGRVAGLGEMVPPGPGYERPGPADWATGAAWLVSRRCLGDVGPWDERFFLYSEEVDFALRARDAGYGTWFEPQAVVEHIGGDARISPPLWALLTTNKVRFYAKRHGPVATTAYRAAFTLGAGLRTALGSRTHRAALVALLGRGTGGHPGRALGDVS